MTKPLPSVGLSAQDINVFFTPKAYHQQVISLIKKATKRIYITALYVQDDVAGREVLHAIYQAKEQHPELEVKIFVDCHRAQRGLIGEKESLGNRALYLQLAEQYQQQIDIYGVAVKPKEFLGVLHLKGMVFDDTVFYSGASINDIYMHTDNRFRIDRYHQLDNDMLANSFCQYLNDVFVKPGLCPLLNRGEVPTKEALKKQVKRLKSVLKSTEYTLEVSNAQQAQAATKGDIFAKPLVGFGRRKKQLNQAIRHIVQHSQSSLLVFTPYFNVPKPLTRDLVQALKRGVKVTLVIGDKTANDFFIKDEDSFSTIGIIPYLYEVLLVRFLKRWQKYIDSGLLEVRLWKNGDHSFHLKGIVADKRYHLITGSNLNPRAWSLDLENGILLDDPKGHLVSELDKEKAEIFAHAPVVKHFQSLETVADYPDKPRKLIKKINMVQIDRILKRFL